MRALIVAIAALATISVASIAVAQQQRNFRDMMSDMKVSYGQTFDQCQSLATSRGYRLGELNNEYEGMGLAMFIEGCIMGQQR